jgi:hypothetical protein
MRYDLHRHDIKEDKARGIAEGQRWDGEGGQFRVITGIISVEDHTTPWVLIRHLNQDGKIIEGSGVEWSNWVERCKARMTRSKPI